MFGAILKATNSSFQKGMTFFRSIYVKKVMKLLAFIFEQPLEQIKSILSQKLTTIGVTTPQMTCRLISECVTLTHAGKT